jgi:DNA-binding transcriptional ArsR family regulator
MHPRRPPATIGVMADHELPDRLIELIARRFRVLGDPTRIRLLGLLCDESLSVQELAWRLGATQQNVSKHLGVLLQAGIVERRKLGNHAYYSVADEDVFGLCELVCAGLSRHLASLGDVVGAGR